MLLKDPQLEQFSQRRCIGMWLADDAEGMVVIDIDRQTGERISAISFPNTSCSTPINPPSAIA